VAERVNGRRGAARITNESIEVGVAVGRRLVNVLAHVTEQVGIGVDARETAGDIAKVVILVRRKARRAIVCARHGKVRTDVEEGADAAHDVVDAAAPHSAVALNRKLRWSVCTCADRYIRGR
jgi:hypothetical protein